MHGQTRIPDSETRKRHVYNMQAVCQQLEMLIIAIDGLITY
jgi:hypothetical protein